MRSCWVFSEKLVYEEIVLGEDRNDGNADFTVAMISCRSSNEGATLTFFRQLQELFIALLQ